MAPDYSVYTVLQASRRSWRIGQTEPVKVCFFCYEDTIQEDALHLVAAKVAAALRVNGDSVGDDSLAELDSLTGGDLISTLAKIVTGDVKIEARSLQAAFAEANADFQASNAIIGNYMMTDDEEPEPEMANPVVIEGVTTGNGVKRPLLDPAQTNGNGQQQSLFDPHAGTNGKPIKDVDGNGAVNGSLNGRSPNGNTATPSQLAELDVDNLIEDML